MKVLFRTLTAVLALCLMACSSDLEILETPVDNAASNNFEAACLPLEMVMTLDDETRTSHTYDYGTNILKTAWADGDVVYVAPGGYSSKGCCYHRKNGNTFVADKSLSANYNNIYYYYPGDVIVNDNTFRNFSYEGQIQKKSDPKGHLGAYHTMRQRLSKSSDSFDLSEVSFKGCSQSGCIRFNLSGTTFKNPTKLIFSIIEDGVATASYLYSNNYLSSYINDSAYGVTANGLQGASSLSINLEGYGTESSLEVFMMLSNWDMTIASGTKMRVSVIGDESVYADTDITSSVTMKGGYCSILTVNSGWKTLNGDYNDYAWDGDIVTLQRGQKSGLDLVIMGDGFIKEDFDNGTYEDYMVKTYNAFFAVFPYNVLKPDFNVYYIKTVSPERVNATNTGSNGATNTGTTTRFGAKFTANSTNIKGNTALARQLAKTCFTTNANERIKDATIIVVVNQACHAGTCHTSRISGNPYDYGQSSSVAFCALELSETKRCNTIRHEAGGHGFGKLADEYYSSNPSTFDTSKWTSLATDHGYGSSRNASKYVTLNFKTRYPEVSATNTAASEVLWYDMFGTRNNYESEDVESLGIFEGGKTMKFGFCRPTELSANSIMMSNGGIFNAICRRQIYYRYRYLTGQITNNCWGTSAELNAFLTWDAENFLDTRSSSSASLVQFRPPMLDEDADLLPLGEPVIEEGKWVDGVFEKN